MKLPVFISYKGKIEFTESFKYQVIWKLAFECKQAGWNISK